MQRRDFLKRLAYFSAAISYGSWLTYQKKPAIVRAETPVFDIAKVSGSDIRLNYQSIVYAEHFSHMIHIHTPAKKTLITRLPFKSFIAPLCQDARFFVCGRGVIVPTSAKPKPS